ncbi:MAG TPA: 50S ribosomal protein L32 [Pyrinomonadaceae bacterium]|nr:50S ribosomal protein L32 [Pyrinomonadaceae bacterium]
MAIADWRLPIKDLGLKNNQSAIGNRQLAIFINGVIMPNPKRRHSKARRDKRRAHDALRAPQTNLCPNCREPRMPHRVCPKCGFYNGREVVQVEQS